MLSPDEGEAAVRAMADQVSRVAPGTLEDAFSNRLWQGFELGALLRQITTPTLMIHGDVESGAVVSAEDAEFVRQQLPSARVIRIPNAGHLIPVDHPAFTLQSINEFLHTS
jgi:pimeloyl-ACP methyl ester carboxylesterase